jgi:ABC-type phosphate transport system substrate-binding protein
MKRPMRTLVLLAALAAARAGAAPNLAVIGHPDLPVSSLSGEELRAIFLAAKTTLRDSQVHPVLQKRGPALSEFSTEYLGKTEAALTTYYRSLVFTGRWSMPVTLSSDAEMVAYVSKTPGAIGFVSDASLARGVKTLKVK